MNEMKNKKVAIIIIAVLLIVAVAVYLCTTLGRNKSVEPEESSAPIESVEPTQSSNDDKDTSAGKTDGKDNKPVNTPAPAESAAPNGGKAPVESVAPTPNGGNTGSGNQTSSGQVSGSTGSNTQTGGNSGGNTGTSTGGNTGNTGHQHNWQPVYKTVHHDEVGHYETVVVQAAWDEPVFESHAICSGCGAWIDNNLDHIFDCGEYGSGYSVHEVQTGTVHHDAVTEQRWIVDTPAYDEQVITGYKCSCGQEK